MQLVVALYINFIIVVYLPLLPEAQAIVKLLVVQCQWFMVYYTLVSSCLHTYKQLLACKLYVTMHIHERAEVTRSGCTNWRNDMQLPIPGV